jgi:hypothetical protein
MLGNSRSWARVVIFSSVVLGTLGIGIPASAGEHTRRVRATAMTRVRPCVAPTSTLGNFTPTPVITIRGNIPVGGGYSPLGMYGDQTMALYGPLSPLRGFTAPVVGYVRGYDGQLHVTEALSFSNPNLPELSPFHYPSQANYYFGPRVNRTPYWGSSAINWIDQN